MATVYTPARATPHVSGSAPTSTRVAFVAPAGAVGFYLTVDKDLCHMTVDGTNATVSNGLVLGVLDAILFPIQPDTKVDIFNANAATVNITILWLEAIT